MTVVSLKLFINQFTLYGSESAARRVTDMIYIATKRTIILALVLFSFLGQCALAAGEVTARVDRNQVGMYQTFN